nr:BadF/BadG/BcrA/BcrD ATPase family protein [Phytoactinopolyspora alkaliphila]
MVLGLDIGGTSTRALVIDTVGRRIASARGPGANLTSHGAEVALAAISSTVTETLAGVEDAGAVRHAVVGTAGAANLLVPSVAAEFRRMWHDTGLMCPYDVVSDARVAYVAGTAEPAGTLLLCGTGALAARFEDRRRTHTVDGHGWLLGDTGSGFWLGREAARVTLAALDQTQPPGPLARAVFSRLLPDEPDPWKGGPATTPTARQLREVASRLVLAVHSRAPVTLAELAPLVSAEVHSDPQAQRLVTDAAEHVLRAAAAVRAEGDATPIVFAGSLLTSPTPLRRVLEPRLNAHWPHARISAATDGAAGAAWLAAAHLLGPDSSESAELHARLLDQ